MMAKGKKGGGGKEKKEKVAPGITNDASRPADALCPALLCWGETGDMRSQYWTGVVPSGLQIHA